MTDAFSAPPAGAWAWCHDPARAPEIGRFLAAQVGRAYISHAELQTGRAEAPGRWRGDLAARVEAEARRAILGEAAGFGCALAEGRDGIAGLAFVRFAPDGEPAFAVIEDLLIDAAQRGGGLGAQALAWIEAEARRRGCERLFLESGLANHAAHRFFKRQGFAQTSIVMMRDLCAS